MMNRFQELCDFMEALFVLAVACAFVFYVARELV